MQLGDVENIKINSCDDAQALFFNDIPFAEYGEQIDLLVGGFPCQSYSVAGKRRGIQDERGQLIYQVFRLLRESQPKYFLLENVKGLLSIDNGNTFKNILKELNDCGYAVDWMIINSALVTAQKRERVYILGKRLDICQDSYIVDI